MTLSANLLPPIPSTFDLPPIYDEAIKHGSLYLSEVWIAYWTTFINNLTAYLSQYGINVPNLTQAQINTIQTPINGQTLYNLTADTMQYYQISSGTWIAYP